MKKTFLPAALGAALLIICVTPGQAHDTKPLPQAHAPIGVMGDHRHGAGEFMLSYRYMRMHMAGNGDGSGELSVSDVNANYGYPVVPTSMDMDMHMVGAMYGLTDAVTIMAMLPFVKTSMDHHVVPMNVDFTTSASGIGDAKLSALIGLNLGLPGKFHIQAGLSFPTGSIDKRDDTPMMANALLPYPMQLGSGTYDFIGNATWTVAQEGLSGGVQVSTVARTGENDRDYRLGNIYQATLFAAGQLNDWVSLSGRIIGKHVGDIKGANPALNPMMVQTADPANHGGQWISLGVGLNFVVPEGALQGQRLAVEFTAPVYQNLNGPQLRTKWTLTAGWQYAFDLF